MVSMPHNESMPLGRFEPAELLAPDVAEHVSSVVGDEPCRSGFEAGALVMASLQPHRFESGVDRETEHDVVSRGAVGRERRDGLWPVIRGERHAVWRAAIPYFNTVTESRVLHVRGAPSSTAFSPPRDLRGRGDRFSRWASGTSPSSWRESTGRWRWRRDGEEIG